MNKTRKVPKSKTIHRFSSLAKKPAQPKKGVSYAVEKAENVDPKTGKKIDGDIFKKYENSVLKRQIFVPKVHVKKLVQTHASRLKNRQMGGDSIILPPLDLATTEKMNGGNARKTRRTKIVYVKEAPVTVQDGTTFGQALKTGVAGGIGWGLGNKVIDGLFGDN